MKVLKNELIYFATALMFFTRIPVPFTIPYSSEIMNKSQKYFAWVGLVIGLINAVVLYLSTMLFNLEIGIVLMMISSVLLTGAFHEDGLADTADGLGGGFTRERALDIMKDSRIGTYGAIALVLAVLAKISLLVLLAQIHPQWVLVALFAAHVSSRYMPLWLIRCLAHVGDTAQSKSKPLADSIGLVGLVVGGMWWLSGLGLVAFFLPWGALLVAVLAAVAAAALLGWRLHQRLQGYTGDGLGAAQQLSEIAFYLGLCLAASAAQP